ncbi:MAG TPA: CsgG/HfaB family protein [Candidatus Acidoferrum sp.]|nr:CsgG/HfaB family protein [Candidatus Acidoferrum sp.]
MKKTFLAAIAALLINGVSLLNAAEPPPLSVAVFDFESKEDSIKDLGPKISALLNALLSTNEKLILVERTELDKALGEQELGLSGTVSTETAAKIGHLTGAKVLITGKLMKIDKDVLIVAKVIGTETSRVYGETVKAPASGAIDELATQLADKISNTVEKRADTLVAKVLSREDRVATIKAGLKEMKRPAVSIKLPEKHFGAPVVDPAAETELSLILQQAGFEIVDDKSAQKADVEITGEAFSAFALRRGNLISCKARVELKAHTKADGKILTVDRETSVALDTTEQTAAKTALQQAAAELASRIALKLVGHAKVAVAR